MEGKHKRSLRFGYTTGTYAAAAVKAAAVSFFCGCPPKEVRITLPAGTTVDIPLKKSEFTNGKAVSSTVKESGDAPDVTNGVEIIAEIFGGDAEFPSIKRTDKGSGRYFFPLHGAIFTLHAGRGVGIVTKPGLAISKGEPAINPVPRSMIINAVQDAIDMCQEKASVACRTSDIHIVLSVLNGEEIAAMTMNSRLGIIGGISILGTSGIVKPISLTAWTDTISVSLDVARAAGIEEVVLTTGRMSERAAMDYLKLPEEAYIQMGDHVGYALSESLRKGFSRICIAGQFGKLVKIASGEFKTNVRDSALELNILSEIVLKMGVDKSSPLYHNISSAGSARHAFGTITANGLDRALFQVCCMVKENSMRFLMKDRQGGPHIRCLLAGYDGVVKHEA